jgi:hypothetical protein
MGGGAGGLWGIIEIMADKVGPEEVRRMIEMKRRGFSRRRIAEILHRSPYTIDKWLNAATGESKARGNIVVLHDPSGLFEPGAEFSTLDLQAGIPEQVWLDGMQFGIRNNGTYFEAEVKYSIVADDGRVLQKGKGGSYKWVRPEKVSGS